MRALLTGGIKAILAIAALSTAAHWAMRVQREAPTSVAALPGLAEPATTGSIEPRRAERPAAVGAPAQVSVTAGLDQGHLAALIAGAAPAKPKAARTAARTASAPEKVAAKR